MHILFLPSWYPFENNPAGIFVLDQARALAKKEDVRISIINWGPNEFVFKARNPLQSLRRLVSIHLNKNRIIELGTNLNEYKIPHLTWTSHIFKGNYGSLIPKLIRLIKKIESKTGKIDLIHAHITFPAGFLAYHLSEHLSVPYIITEHSGPFPFKEYKAGKGLKQILAVPLAGARQVIAVSNYTAESISAYTHMTPVVIANSVNTDIFKPKPDFRYNEIPHIFTLSSMTKEKGIGDLLESIRLLKSRGYKFLVRIGGAGKRLDSFRKLSEKLKISDYIIWLGSMGRKEALIEYKNCDFYVMPSRQESLSMVILEATACGKPVVATDCGGPKDLISKVNGILVKPDDSQSLAKCIEEMLNKYYTFDSVKIRELCVSEYADNVIAEKLILIYNSLITNS